MSDEVTESNERRAEDAYVTVIESRFDTLFEKVELAQVAAEGARTTVNHWSKRLEKLLDGNGKPGHEERMKPLEDDLQARQDTWKQIKSNVIRVCVIGVFGMISIGLTYYFVALGKGEI